MEIILRCFECCSCRELGNGIMPFPFMNDGPLFPVSEKKIMEVLGAPFGGSVVTSRSCHSVSDLPKQNRLFDQAYTFICSIQEVSMSPLIL